MKGFKDAKKFDWGLYPRAEKFLKRQMSSFVLKNSLARKLSKAMEKETSTSLFDWVDHIAIPHTSKIETTLKKLGFEQVAKDSPDRVYQHVKSILVKSILFPVLLRDKGIELALKPEVVSHCSRKWNHGIKIKGSKHAPYRWALLKKQGNTILSAARGGDNLFNTF